jgi:hypothetical protein
VNGEADPEKSDARDTKYSCGTSNNIHANMVEIVLMAVLFRPMYVMHQQDPV